MADPFSALLLPSAAAADEVAFAGVAAAVENLPVAAFESVVAAYEAFAGADGPSAVVAFACERIAAAAVVAGQRPGVQVS